MEVVATGAAAIKVLELMVARGAQDNPGGPVLEYLGR